VLKQLGNALTVFALLAAIGAHWVVLQSMAWTTMLAENLRHSSVTEAVGRTFDGKHPCAICKEIAKGQRSEKKSEFRPEWKKFEFSYTPSRLIFAAPLRFWETCATDVPPKSLPCAPPVPPPRPFLG
jgi:hypothetical protein